MTTLSPNLAVMIRAAEKAARSLMRDFNEVEKLQISIKGPGDFVTRADRRSQEIILESLQKDRPEWGFLGEEGADIKGKDARYRWIVDPLDGTTNFLHGLPHWCITIALEKDGEIVAGITYDPLRDETFRAEKGDGAFMNNSRLRVSGRKDAAYCLVALNIGSKKIQEDLQAPIISNLMTQLYMAQVRPRMMMSGALDLAYVAAGRFDAAYMDGQSPWDIAAGILLVREAKGIVTHLDQRSAHHSQSDLLAGNPDIHAAMAKLIAQNKAA